MKKSTFFDVANMQTFRMCEAHCHRNLDEIHHWLNKTFNFLTFLSKIFQNLPSFLLNCKQKRSIFGQVSDLVGHDPSAQPKFFLAYRKIDKKSIKSIKIYQIASDFWTSKQLSHS